MHRDYTVSIKNKKEKVVAEESQFIMLQASNSHRLLEHWQKLRREFVDERERRKNEDAWVIFQLQQSIKQKR